MSLNYLDRLLEMVAELEAHPHIEVSSTFRVKPPATPQQLAAAEQYHPLEPAMRDFYEECNGFVLEWRYDGPLSELGLPIEGCIRIWGVEETFRHQIGSMYFEHGRIHPVDYFAPEACAALVLSNDGPAQIVLHSETNQPMGVGFAEYFELLLASRGFWYWQTALAEPEFDTMPMGMEELGFRLIMPELFHDFDANRFPASASTSQQEVAASIEVIGGDTSALPRCRYFASLQPGSSPHSSGATSKAQSKVAMLVVCWFVGWLGIHRLLMGHKNWWLVALTCGGCGFWQVIDLILILTDNLRMADGRALE